MPLGLFPGHGGKFHANLAFNRKIIIEIYNMNQRNIETIPAVEEQVCKDSITAGFLQAKGGTQTRPPTPTTSNVNHRIRHLHEEHTETEINENVFFKSCRNEENYRCCKRDGPVVRYMKTFELSLNAKFV